MAALLASAFAMGWWKGGDAVQRKWDADTAREVKAQLVKNQADSAKLKKLEETKNENIVEIDRLHANNHALWLRLPKTTCGGSSTPSSDTTSAAGELPTKSERDLAEAKRRLDDESYRADKIVEECRVLNDFLK